MSGDTGQALQRAADALARGDHQAVLACVQPLDRPSQQDPRVAQYAALAHRAAGDSRAALAAIRRAARLSADDPRIAAAEATISYEAGLPATALWERAIRLAPPPPDLELALSLAAAHWAEGRPAAAEALIADILLRQPEWVRGHQALASYRWLSGDREAFDRSFAPAAASAPISLPLRLAWQRALAQAGLLERASAVIRAARAQLGDRMELDAAAASHATEMGHDQEAERLFARVADLADPGTQLAFVRHSIRTGLLDRAESIAAQLTSTAAANGAWPYLGTIWRLKGDPRADWLDGAPPFIRSYDLGLTSAEIDAVIGLVRRLHLAVQHPAEQSMRGGTQTEGQLFQRLDPELAPVRRAALAAVRRYIDGLPDRDPRHPLLGPPRAAPNFAGSWSVRLGRQGRHVAHVHSQGWISSALYLAVPPLDALGPAPAGWLTLGAAPADLRVHTPPLAQLEPKAGRLVLFPSTMWHATEPFDHGERLTIAFDIVPGTAG
ncbi:putative 2OG-Fe(II) oxygenase [uncultured Sphingomonas sp.]|uniref:putative 2OG-Fe(II) oxygenase n=1 Tax=uncultured Sphingomonas sp. TaxID=158754 RepID=UPI0035C99F03